MTREADIRADLDPDLQAPEAASLLAVADRLDRERPVPRPSWRGDTGRYLTSELETTRHARPRRFRLLVAGYAGSGAVLLAVALIGVAGAGPLSG
jgi:hypothetical protein